MLVTKMPDGSPELFLGAQGEGTTIGRPYVFVRFSVCNLHCRYCDSYFTWNFDDIKTENYHCKNKVSKKVNQMQMTVKEMVDHITKFPCKRVLFTGGEPMIYQNEILEVILQLLKKDDRYWFEIETNGTIKLKDELFQLINQINCSPKLESSGNSPLIANKSEVIKQFKTKSNTVFKFVITKRTVTQDIIEIKEWQSQYDIPNDEIWLMPEGISRKIIIEGSKYIIEHFCSQGYNLSTRLHVILFNNQRAV